MISSCLVHMKSDPKRKSLISSFQKAMKNETFRNLFYKCSCPVLFAPFSTFSVYIHCVNQDVSMCCGLISRALIGEKN